MRNGNHVPEPDAGTDVANYKTNTDRVGNKLRLNGVKTLISRAEEAGMGLDLSFMAGMLGELDAAGADKAVREFAAAASALIAIFAAVCTSCVWICSRTIGRRRAVL